MENNSKEKKGNNPLGSTAPSQSYTFVPLPKIGKVFNNPQLQALRAVVEEALGDDTLAKIHSDTLLRVCAGLLWSLQEGKPLSLAITTKYGVGSVIETWTAKKIIDALEAHKLVKAKRPKVDLLATGRKLKDSRWTFVQLTKKAITLCNRLIREETNWEIEQQ